MDEEEVEVGWREKLKAASRKPWVWVAGGFLGFILWIVVRTVLLGNTGFEPKTLWDWMELLLVPSALAGAGLWFSQVQKKSELEIAMRERKTDREIARDRQRQNTLDKYFDQMTDLILEKGLGPEASSDVRRLAQIRTLIVLRDLDADRNRQVVKFLQDAELIGTETVIDLSRAKLSEADLRGADLYRVGLWGADLSKARLVRSFLLEARLSEADLREADLSEAMLSEADLRKASLSRAKLGGANLIEAKLSGANLSEANLSGAELSYVRLSGANLRGANLYAVILNGADLSGANLKGARNWTLEQLLEVESLSGATMPDGSRYEDWIQRHSPEAQPQPPTDETDS